MSEVSLQEMMRSCAKKTELHSTSALLSSGATCIDGLEASNAALREELTALRDGNIAMETVYLATKKPLAKIKADAIMSLCEHGNWDGREDGEYYYSASTVKKFAEEIEDGL